MHEAIQRRGEHDSNGYRQVKKSNQTKKAANKQYLLFLMIQMIRFYEHLMSRCPDVEFRIFHVF